MKFLALLFCCLALLPACTTPHAPAEPRWPGEPAGGRYDFNWQLSGDRAVAPLQVFHDGSDTWLHFAPGQAVPALFVDSGQGERLVPYRRQDPYVVVRGVWPVLLMRGGRSQASARYLGGDFAPTVARAVAAATPSLNAPLLARGDAAADSRHADPSSREASASLTAAEVPADGATDRVFHASPADGTMRALLRDWSRQAGWTFESEHWAVDVDIPLSGSASFGAGYQDAVRGLLRASEMGERPVQPCFYSNRVLRVVPLNEPCDRSADAAGRPA